MRCIQWLALAALFVGSARAAGGPNVVTTLPLNFDSPAWSEPGSCKAHSWKDYMVNVSAADAYNNMIFEVEDLNPETEGYKNEAVSVLLFHGKIPTDRSSPLRIIEGVDRLYSIVIDALHMKSGLYYISVLGGEVDTTYRIRARPIRAQLSPGVITEGEVCPERWIYHSLTIPETAAVANELSITLTVDHYDAFVMSLRAEMPLAVTAPYEIAAEGHPAEITTCDISPGEYYLALYGNDHCVQYTIEYHLQASSTCHASEMSTAELPGQRHAETIALRGSTTGECQAREYVDYMVHLSEEHHDNNFVVTVKGLSDTLDVNSLGVYLFFGSIPADRQTERYQEFSGDNTYSIAVNYHDIQQGDYFVSVRCGNSP
eukprot:SAG22_NODE_2478_length_2529_cov_6.910700_1_plen_372_part_10